MPGGFVGGSMKDFKKWVNKVRLGGGDLLSLDSGYSSKASSPSNGEKSSKSESRKSNGSFRFSLKSGDQRDENDDDLSESFNGIVEAPRFRGASSAVEPVSNNARRQPVLRESRSDYEEPSEKISQISEERDELKRKLESLAAEHDKIRSKDLSSSREIEELEETKEVLDKTVHSLRLELDSVKEERDSLKKLNESQASEIVKLQSNQTQFKKVVKEYEKMLEELMLEKNSSNLSTDKQVELLTAEYERVKTELQQRTEDLRETEIAFNSIHSKAERLKETVVVLMENEKKLKQALEEARTATLESDRVASQMVETAQDKIERAWSEVEEMKASKEREVSALRCQLRLMESELSSAQISYSQKEKEVKELSVIIEELLQSMGVKQKYLQRASGWRTFSSSLLRPSSEMKPSVQDIELEKRKQLIEMERYMLEEMGEQAPSVIPDSKWSELLSLNGPGSRRRFFMYLFKTEKARENELKKKAEHKIAQQLHREAVLAQRAANEHINYGLGQNSYLLKVYDRTIDMWGNYRLANAMKFGQTLLVDVGFDDQMSMRESRNCAEQLMNLFAANRMSPDPFHLRECSSGLSEKAIGLASLGNPLHFFGEDYHHDFFQEKLVYLTPHCRDDLIHWDHDAVYIVGAIVDKTKQEPLSLAKAKKLGLKFRRLPLDRYLE
ncbi:unnamed protein product [Notodromas monacha]|uniref:SAM-dependent MTase TRM10-type domain-containing protein n=1 Tax=Notodromas monacha TaxID=399045 RepID=A0A7R9GH80_9CRUS|nr:unnamed protein product [Notodromas monacha]CAG0921029.1 unnamed protein product [Notodromas monacha]